MLYHFGCIILENIDTNIKIWTNKIWNIKLLFKMWIEKKLKRWRKAIQSIFPRIYYLSCCRTTAPLLYFFFYNGASLFFFLQFFKSSLLKAFGWTSSRCHSHSRWKYSRIRIISPQTWPSTRLATRRDIMWRKRSVQPSCTATSR